MLREAPGGKETVQIHHGRTGIREEPLKSNCVRRGRQKGIRLFVEEGTLTKSPNEDECSLQKR